MKKILILLTTVLLMTSGCSGSDLEDYKQSVLDTQAYETGTMVSDMSIDLTFNEEGLSFEEVRDLSYFEEIAAKTEVTYDSTGAEPKSVINGYFNFGGLGFDMVYYIDGEDILIKLPIMDKFIDVDTAADFGGEFSSEASGAEQEKAIKRIVDTWNSVLGSEDVFSGKKAYVLTDRGQIKTTTYTVNINDEQFTVLKEAFLEILEDEQLIESFLANGNTFSDYDMTAGEMQANIREMVSSLSLVSFEGVAYVDFDGRLVRQVFEAALKNDNAKPGSVETLLIRYETTYDKLGEALNIVIPEVNEEDMLDMEQGGSLEDYFPEGLFE